MRSHCEVLRRSLPCRFGRLRLSPTPLCIALSLALTAVSVAQKPSAQLPSGISLSNGSYVGTVMQTSYSLPTGGTTWAAHTASQLTSALNTSVPGDVIVLDAGIAYVGNFFLPAKSNPSNKWIYIISSQLASLPEGTRVSPSEAASMPKIVTPNASSAIYQKSGANYWRISGIEIYSTSTYRPGGSDPNYYGGALVQNYDNVPAVLPDSIIFDRCYIHGDPTHDLQRGLSMNWSHAAVVDSWLSDIHAYNVEAQAVGAWWSPGPFKIVNNHLEAATENLMFGGSGGPSTPWVPSDIEIRNNHLYKPLTWAVVGVGVSPGSTMIIKDSFELKSAQRVLFDGNLVENNWYNGQQGYAVQLTVRTGQSGDIAVVDDVTMTNNTFQNVVSGIDSLAKDDTCGIAPYTSCHNAGSQDRWYIADNLFIFFDPMLPGGLRNVGFLFSRGIDHPNGGILGNMQDVVLQHNTMVSAASTPCYVSIYFSSGQEPYPPTSHVTNNVWILDNVLCSQPNGDWGVKGTSGLDLYMAYPNISPNDVTQRYYGNVMWKQNATAYVFPTSNDVASTIGYVDPTHSNYQLASPYWTYTSDGNLSGVNMSEVPVP